MIFDVLQLYMQYSDKGYINFFFLIYKNQFLNKTRPLLYLQIAKACVLRNLLLAVYSKLSCATSKNCQNHNIQTKRQHLKWTKVARLVSTHIKWISRSLSHDNDAARIFLTFITFLVTFCQNLVNIVLGNLKDQ